MFPNQICTMSQAMDLRFHFSEPSVQSVKSNPEKHVAAMPMKKTNSAVMARSALGAWKLLAREVSRNKAVDAHDYDVIGNHEECESKRWLRMRNAKGTRQRSNLGKSMQAPQASMSKPRSEVEAINLVRMGDRDSQNRKHNSRSPEERPFTRRMRYRVVTPIKELSNTFHI